MVCVISHMKNIARREAAFNAVMLPTMSFKHFEHHLL